MCAYNGEMENYDYLRECIDNFENKDSGVSLSASTNTTDIGLQGDSLDDVNLNSIDFMKIENLLLQNSQESENCIKNEETKQEKSTDVSVSSSVENFNTINLSYNTFSNFSNDLSKQSDDVTAINNSDSYTFNKNLTTQCVEGNQSQVEKYNCFIKLHTNNKDTNFIANKDNNSVSPNVRSELIPEIKNNTLELLDRNEQTQKCEQCQMTFRYKRHLDRHLEGHQKNNCTHCNEKFARRKHLEVHLFRAHGERVIRHPYLCDVCPRSFPKRALLNRHRAKHSYQEGKVCPECGNMINTDANEEEHKEKHCKKKQFKCQQCFQTFSIEQTYLSHIQNHNNYKCPNCDVGFASKKKAHEHFRAIHSPKLNEQESTNNGKY